MEITDLPSEIQNHIFYYWAEHPAATVIRDYFQTRCDACDEAGTRWYDDVYLTGFFCKSCYDAHVVHRTCVECGQLTEDDGDWFCMACDPYYGEGDGDEDDEDGGGYALVAGATPLHADEDGYEDDEGYALDEDGYENEDEDEDED